jgi:hypothetical protein
MQEDRIRYVHEDTFQIHLCADFIMSANKCCLNGAPCICVDNMFGNTFDYYTCFWLTMCVIGYVHVDTFKIHLYADFIMSANKCCLNGAPCICVHNP